MKEGEEDELARLRAENARLAQELAEERGRFQRTLSSGLVGLVLSSFELGRYVEVNQVFADLLGYTREEILATDPYQFWVKTTFSEDVESERKQLQRVFAGEIESYRVEKRCVRKSGDVRWFEFELACVRNDAGNVRYGVISARDIHDLKTAEAARAELEAKLRQVEKMETVGRLVGGVAHDFNNRLMVIMGYADMVKDGVAHDALLAGQAEVVVSSARRAAELTRQLLAYSRKQVLRPKAADLNAVVDGTRRMLERLIGEHIELATVLGAKHPMLADPGQIEQVLMNLLINARDAMPNGGRVTLRTMDVTITPEAPVAHLSAGNYVAFAVTDTGSGIPEALRAQVFEPFFTTKGVGRGTGLGLAMVEGIVRQSGGAIVLESTVGHGTTFTVYLPRAADLAPAADAGLTRDRVQVAGLRSSEQDTVLVVDDEDDVRTLLTEVLQMGPFRVLAARDATQALELARNHAHAVTLLITDIAMPGMSGTELADELRARNPALKVLFVSGYADHESARSFFDSEQFIPKPFLPAELFHKVDVLLRSPTPGVEQTA